MIEFLVFLVLWLPACFVVAYVARQRGRSGFGFFLLSFFLTPVIGFLAAVAVPRIERKPFFTPGYLDKPAPTRTKKCPICAETIQAEALKCRYCGADQPAADAMGKCPGCFHPRRLDSPRCVLCGNTERVT